MPTISEPLAESQAWTYTRCRVAFQAGQIGEATFRVSLSILGLRKQDIDAEMYHARQEMQRTKALKNIEYFSPDPYAKKTASDVLKGGS